MQWKIGKRLRDMFENQPDPVGYSVPATICEEHGDESVWGTPCNIIRFSADHGIAYVMRDNEPRELKFRRLDSGAWKGYGNEPRYLLVGERIGGFILARNWDEAPLGE